MAPGACPAPGFCESELICLVGFCHPNCHQGGQHFSHFLTENSALPGSVAFICPHKGAQGSPSEGLEHADALAGMPSSSCPQMPHAQTSKFLFVWWGGVEEGSHISHVPNLEPASIFPFLHVGQGEKKEREAFEKCLLCHSLSKSPCR